MIINGEIVSYEFGPLYDMDIRFTRSFESQAGTSYDRCGNGAQLIFQLLCHAVHQLQYIETNGWRLDKIEEMSEWEYPTPGPGETLEFVVTHKDPILVTRPLTYAKYQITVEGRLVLTLREGQDCDYLIDYYDPDNDYWLESVFDCAQDHCKRFGRMQ